MMWLNKIPLAKGLVNLKTDYDANKVLLSATIVTATAQAILDAKLKDANLPYGVGVGDTDTAKVITFVTASAKKNNFALGMALSAFHTSYKPEIRTISYTTTQLTAYRNGTNTFSHQLSLMKDTGKLQVTKSEDGTDANKSAVE